LDVKEAITVATKKFRELESKLSPQQRKAALLLVNNDLAEAEEGRRSLDKIADEVDTSLRNLHRWKNENSVFIEYMNLIADDFLASYRSGVYRQMMKLINSQQPSVKAMDLYFKRFGLLTERQITESADTNDDQNNESIAKEIAEFDSELNEGNDD
jgi:hypothetical protein